MKKTKLLLIVLPVVAIAAIITIISVMNINKPSTGDIDLCNRCKDYAEKYLDKLPSDVNILSDIYDDTSSFLSNNTYEKAFKYSDYYDRFKSECEKGFAVATGEDGLKQEYCNEVIMLHLKVLVALNKSEEYNEKLYKYFDMIESNVATVSGTYSHWFSEENFPVKKDNDIFNMIVAGYESTISKCTNDVDKYVVLNTMYWFYGNVDGCKKEVYATLERSKTLANKYETGELAQKAAAWSGFEK